MALFFKSEACLMASVRVVQPTCIYCMYNSVRVQADPLSWENVHCSELPVTGFNVELAVTWWQRLPLIQCSTWYFQAAF